MVPAAAAGVGFVDAAPNMVLVGADVVFAFPKRAPPAGAVAGVLKVAVPAVVLLAAPKFPKRPPPGALAVVVGAGPPKRLPVGCATNGEGVDSQETTCDILVVVLVFPKRLAVGAVEGFWVLLPAEGVVLPKRPKVLIAMVGCEVHATRRTPVMGVLASKRS